MVYLARILTRLEEIAGVKELGLKLLDQRWGDGQRQKNAEEAGLHVDARVFQFVEGEAVEQARDDVQDEFADCVLGGAPVAYECPLHHRADLGVPGHGEFAVVGYLVF